MTSVNLDAWNKLSKKNQAIIEKPATEMQPIFWQSSKDEDAMKLKTLGGNGVKISTPSPALKKDLVKIGMKMWADFSATSGAAAAKTIKEYRADIGK